MLITISWFLQQTKPLLMHQDFNKFPMSDSEEASKLDYAQKHSVWINVGGELRLPKTFLTNNLEGLPITLEVIASICDNMPIFLTFYELRAFFRIGDKAAIAFCGNYIPTQYDFRKSRIPREALYDYIGMHVRTVL